MARLKLDLDRETFQKLLRTALAERRPVHWQAEIMLRSALGLPFPYRSKTTAAQASLDSKASLEGEGADYAKTE